MKTIMRAPVATAIAITAGLLILAGYFIDIPVLNSIRLLLLEWTVLLGAFAALIGMINLLRVHWNKGTQAVKKEPLRLIVIVAFAAAFIYGVVISPDDANFQQIVYAVQIPVEVSLLAVTGVTLSIGAFRLFQRRTGIIPVVFAGSVVVYLLVNSGAFPSLQASPALENVLYLVRSIPLAGARGLLIGIALGSILTGVRVLFGIDRPYSG